MSRAVFLRSAATESSRSRISPSGPDEGPLASLRSESAGTNRKKRIGLLLKHSSPSRNPRRGGRTPCQYQPQWILLHFCLSILGSLVHQRLARALGDDLAALIEGG